MGEPSRNLRPGKESTVRVECKEYIGGEKSSNLVLSIMPSTSPSTTKDSDEFSPAVVEDVVHFREPRIYDVTLSACGGSIFDVHPEMVRQSAPPKELEEKVKGVGDLWGDCVGSRVMKPFGEDLYEGTVVEHFEGAGGGLWRVRYEDGDEEDVELPELMAAMDLYKRGGIVPYKGVEEGLRKLIEEEEEREEEEEEEEEEEKEAANFPPSPNFPRASKTNDTEITFEPSASLLTAAETPVRSGNDTTIGTQNTAFSTPRTRDGRVYFRRSVVEFGEKTVGTCGSVRLQLCNSTSREVVVRVSEPSCPFVVLHKKIRLKPKAFVRLPVRFVPVSKGLWETMLHCDVGEGRSEIVVLLRGVGK